MTTRKKAPSKTAIKAAADGLGPVGQLRMMEELLSRASFAERAGITYEGSRNLYAALGYKRELEPADYRSRYTRNGIAQQVVAAGPRATWRGGIELVEDQDADVETEFEQEWQNLSMRLRAIPNFQRVDILAGLGKFAILFIGAPGDLSTPLPKRLKAEDIAYLAPFGEEDVTITAWETDTADKRFGLPKTYTLKRHGSSVVGSTPPSISAKPIDWTRVVHIADGIIDERVFGTPRLAGVWNFLDDLDKVTGSGAEAFWQRVHQGMVFSVDADKELSQAEQTNLRTEIDAYIHNLKRAIVARGMKVESLGGDVSNFSNQLDAILTLIAGSVGIPKRILMGSERGELSSTQDRENWEQKITDRRHDFAEPEIIRPFIARLQEHGALPETAEDYEVRWPEIEALTEVEKAQVADSWSKLNGQAGAVVVTAEEIRDRVLRLDPLTPEQIGQEEETIVRAQPAPAAAAPSASAEVPTPVPTIKPAAPDGTTKPPDASAQETTGIALGLNGAQIASATDIVVKVVAGELPRDSGLAMLEYLFGLTPDAAERMMGSAGTETPTTPNPPPASESAPVAPPAPEKAVA